MASRAGNIERVAKAGDVRLRATLSRYSNGHVEYQVSATGPPSRAQPHGRTLGTWGAAAYAVTPNFRVRVEVARAHARAALDNRLDAPHLDTLLLAFDAATEDSDGEEYVCPRCKKVRPREDGGADAMVCDDCWAAITRNGTRAVPQRWLWPSDRRKGAK